MRYEEKLKFVEEFVDPITQDLVQTCPTYAWLKDQTVGPGIYDKSSLLEWIETCRTKGYSTVQDPLKAGDLNTEYPCFQSPLLFRSFERCIRMLQRLQGTSKTHEDSLKDPDSRKRENQENQLDSSSNKHQRIETRASSTMKETKSP